MRHFDIADRDRSRVTGLLQITPWPAFGFSASAAVGKDDYENSGLGLRDSETRSYSVSADLTPGERVAAALSYTTDRYSALQRSRAASSAADMLNPLRNWSLDNEDRVHTIDGSIDLLRLVDKTDLRLGYVFSRSKATYVHTVAEGWPLATPQVLPPVEHELHTGTADLRYALTARLTLGAVYWFDRYQVGDFALGTGTMNRLDLPSSLFLGYVFRPYTAHSGWLRLTYVW